MSSLAISEDILLETGGCGKYQTTLGILVHAIRGVAIWSIFALIVASKTPHWRCTDDQLGRNWTILETQPLHNESLSESCTTASGSRCTTIQFDGELRTIVTEWDLVCDLAWVPATLMSIQMAGLFLGHVCTGHVADAIGRKKPFFFSILLLLIFNICSVFSVSWLMFAVFRFLIGFGLGCFLTVQFSLICELTLSQWRPLVIGTPWWHGQMCLFAFVAWILNDWKYVHIAIAVLAGFSLAAWRFYPESFRWYLAHNRLKDAEAVILKISKFNHKTAPDVSILNRLVKDGLDQNARSIALRKYSVLDLFRSKQLLKETALQGVTWFSLGLASYGINFGIQALSGNIYLNLFLFSVIVMPADILSVYMMNRIGRKASAVILFGVCAAGAVIAGIIQNTDVTMKDKLVTAFAILANFGIGAAWGPIQTLSTEMYPTVVRNIGFGTLNICARIGAVVGPQLVYVDVWLPGTLFFVCFAMCLCSIVAVFLLPETRDVPLTDTLANDKTAAVEECSLDDTIA